MNHPEEAIERVLTGLRDAAAPAGMETRIMGTLVACAARKDPRLRSWPRWMAAPKYRWPAARWAALAVVCGGVAVVALVLAPIQRAGHVAPNGGRNVASSTAPGGAEQVVAQPLEIHNSRRDHGIAEAVSLSATAGPSSEYEKPIDYDLLAVSEMLAPSQQAPPLPPTDQEKLLAQVVRHGDPVQVAELQPEVRAKEMETAKAEFHAFFDPPPPMEDNQ